MTKRMIIIILPLVLVPLFLVLILSSWILGASIRSLILERVEYSNSRINNNFDLFTRQMEDSMRQIIANADVQKSLTQVEVSYTTLNSISNHLKLYNFGPIQEILYMDNQQNIVQTHEFAGASIKSILKSHIQAGVSGTYASPVWTFHEDDISGDSGRFLFITRYIRHLDLDTEPGLLIFKVDPIIMDDIFDFRIMVDNVDYLLLDRNNQLVFHNVYPEWVGTSAESLSGYQGFHEDSQEFSSKSAKTDHYIYTYHLNQQTGWKIIAVIPYRLALQQLRRLQMIIYLIIVAAAGGAVAIVYITSLKFTNPIRELEEAMHSFRDGKFNMRVQIEQNDEIGEMGKSFNLMADEISTLLETIQEDQKALTSAELESLTYQINPHFIYNTLDNVHMLARSSGDKKISQLILSLTKFLRISLSKGQMIISLKDEFEHVENYLKIQRIRFGKTFDFNVTLNMAIEDMQIVKFILQPMAENCITHGFRSIDSGGRIDINGRQIGEKIEICIEDNGAGIDTATL
ncbi:MAG: histidine kinase, partial [Spirochaetales bacterium]|nr:histidine kinase [Spirochaetales bacterium]